MNIPLIIIFCILGLFATVGPILNIIWRLSCKEQVEAKLEETNTHQGNTVQVYSYTYEGKEQKSIVRYSSLSAPKISMKYFEAGKTYTIYFNPKHPRLACLKPHITLWDVITTVIPIVIGIAAFGVAVKEFM